WTYKTFEGYSCIKSAPINIGEKLRTLLFDAKKSIILTSATLRTENSFDFIRDQLSLSPDTGEVVLESHFDYPDQVKIIIAEDLPRPQTEGYFKACSDIIEDIIKANGGRTLVLFTSKKALTATYMAVAPNLKLDGYNVLAQGITGGKGKIMEHFKQEPGTCALFGTASFWEGIDIPGDLLTCIVMQKLPFDPPTDPIIFSRGLKYDDAFNEYQVPLAILKFKQGFGRLIRTSKDKGSMVILDSRISGSAYGQKFLTSLPGGIKIEHATADQVSHRLQTSTQ
ncbi:DNA polymerase III subunit epsilon, partial [Patescibacteria group bacterium]|nr:DNA polymerase III subunit epsilon [Patescibacteria group bacterium]